MFNSAYDEVLAKWPQMPEVVDLAGRFGTTHINVCGPVDAPPLILLSGGGATSTVWFANVAALSSSRRVFAVDTLGDVGRSVPSGDRMTSLDDLLAWVDSIVEHTGAATVDVVGHSYGAMIALAYALRKPERVSKLVLLDPSSCFAGMKSGYLLRAVPLLIAPSDARQRRLLRWEIGGLTVDERWLTLAGLGASERPKPKLVVPPRPSREQLAALKVDLLVVAAAGSRVHDCATVVRAVHESVPDAGIVVLENASHHSIPMVPAAEVNRAVVDFLGE